MHEVAHADAAIREEFFLATMQSVVQICEAFPLMAEAVIELLFKVFISIDIIHTTT